MAYKTDGSSHKNGTSSEQYVCDFFNNQSNYDFIANSINKALQANKIFKKFNFIKKGGPKSRDDIFCLNNKISISIKTKKKHNGKYSGTFDLINTSSVKNFVCGNQKFNDNVDEWYYWLENIQNVKNDTEHIKSNIKKHCNVILNSINGIQIKEIFKKIEDLEDNNIEVIRDYNEKVSEKIKNESLHFLKKNWFIDEYVNNIDKTQVIKTSNSSSFIKNNDGSNGLFRIRVVTNNGANALMRQLGICPKIKSKNNSSCLTFKIQVDKVSKMINKYDVNAEVNLLKKKPTLKQKM